MGTQTGNKQSTRALRLTNISQGSISSCGDSSICTGTTAGLEGRHCCHFYAAQSEVRVVWEVRGQPVDPGQPAIAVMHCLLGAPA